MADLTGTTPADTYKGLLQVNDYTDGVAGNTGSNALAIQDGAGNATALAVSTDSVGIGTTSPSDSLEVISNGDAFGATITNATDNPARLTLTNTEGSASIDSNNNLLRFGNSTAQDVVIDSNGNVGIGTTSPSNLLELRTEPNSGGMADIALYSDGANSNATSSIFLGQSSTRRAEITAIRLSSGNDHELAFSTNLGAAPPVEAMRIDSAGNVGIGTTNFGTNASGVLGIANATAPTSSPADMVQLYAEDVTASSELRVRDEAGNVTTLSPHAKDAPDSLYDNGKGVDEMHRVANHYLGTIVFTNVDRRNDLMQKQLSGEELPEDRTFKVTETFTEYNARTGADLQVEDWDANQQAMFDAQEEKVVARQAEIDAWDNEEEEAPEPLQSYVKKPKPDWLS